MRGNVPDHVVDGVLPEGPVRDQMGIDPQADGSFAGIDASWELDVFGRTKAKVRAASDTLQAQNAKLYEVWVSLSAELALNYITLRTLQAERMVTASHIASEEETLELLQVNRKSGLLSDVPFSSRNIPSIVPVPNCPPSIRKLPAPFRGLPFDRHYPGLS